LKYQKDDTLKTYYKKGYNTNEIPLDELSHYLDLDLLTTGELYKATVETFRSSDSASLRSVRDVTFRTCRVLAKMSVAGIRVDRTTLQHVRHDYEQERCDILQRLQVKTRELMGGTPINLNSPEQLSWVIFSRKPNDKKEWADLFEYVDPNDFKSAVKNNSKAVFKTEANTCPKCDGTGKVYKVKKDGTRYARPHKCPKCDGKGYLLTDTNEMAGLGFFPPSKKWVSANGFGVGKQNLDALIATAKNNNMENAIDFLQDVKRLSAVSSYLSSFVDGISSNTKRDNRLHINLTQHVTSTGRFSGRNPNMQNMPRGGTFPIKRVFISRWDGGKIIEADFAQLEFRTAAFLAQDSTAIREIDTGFDVHSYTAKVISDAGQPTTRQEAKAHTFAPLFGATGYGRSKAEAAYYKQFVEKYKGIAKWHIKLGDEALREGKITNVSGRQYAFPDVVRRENGSPSHFTMIKNYPVQGFATGDVVPVVLIEVDRLLSGMQSCLVNSVHDSMVIDAHPDEIDDVLGIINLINDNLNDIILKEYNIEMNVPLLLESKIGNNWLDTVDV
jgi:DNA polymerase I-like protein with 3'-5' exonuclease and polymerase domains